MFCLDGNKESHFIEAETNVCSYNLYQTFSVILKASGIVSGTGGISKRSVNGKTMPYNRDMKSNSNITCVAAGDWSNIEGMNDWCVSSCPMGNDDTTCLVTYCDCRSQEGKSTI